MGGILPWQRIIDYNGNIPFRPLFDTFAHEKQVEGGYSWGCSCCGYDVRIKQDITLYPVTLWNLLLKALGFQRPSFALASTLERFDIPNDLVALVADKSSWAREGLAVQNTVAEPGWNGYLTLELTNHGDKVIHLKSGMPIAQILFHQLTEPTQRPYQGKYQNQDDRPVEAIKEEQQCEFSFS